MKAKNMQLEGCKLAILFPLMMLNFSCTERQEAFEDLDCTISKLPYWEQEKKETRYIDGALHIITRTFVSESNDSNGSLIKVSGLECKWLYEGLKRVEKEMWGSEGIIQSFLDMSVYSGNSIVYLAFSKPNKNNEFYGAFLTGEMTNCCDRKEDLSLCLQDAKQKCFNPFNRPKFGQQETSTFFKCRKDKNNVIECKTELMFYKFGILYSGRYQVVPLKNATLLLKPTKNHYSIMTISGGLFPRWICGYGFSYLSSINRSIKQFSGKYKWSKDYLDLGTWDKNKDGYTTAEEIKEKTSVPLDVDFDGNGDLLTKVTIKIETLEFITQK